jgi:hypothetical protein
MRPPDGAANQQSITDASTPKPSVDQRGASRRLLGLLGDIQQHAHASQRHKQ